MITEKNVRKKIPDKDAKNRGVSGHISLPFIDRFSKIETFLFRSFFSCYTSLSRFPVNEMKNLLIGSRGDPKSILMKKGSPKCEVPYFHKLQKVWIQKKEKNDGFNKKLWTAIWESNRGGELLWLVDDDSSCLTHGWLI